MSLNKVLRVGVTGGIGAGKTTVSKIFKALGVPVYYADERAKALMVQEPSIILAVVKIFGEEAYNEGVLDRAFIAKSAFHSPELLKELNAVVHPAVGKDYDEWAGSQQGIPYVISEAALMFEAGSYKKQDCVILVSAPKSIRLERTLKRDVNRTKEDVMAIMKNQMPEDEKRALAQYVIENDGSTSLIEQVLIIHQSLLALQAR
ncbi:dephospho-CoA kinase [Marinoscillum sp. MHG1-6]|uniref:dephospho-CoA kinase n=1 Tax=Marinoscillum sp. MHG1-6 TaxID=2959627 RepID=UPI002157F997|nr:dephospho-CoA kinase [Marinoscillum sp. MHG1-6]